MDDELRAAVWETFSVVELGWRKLFSRWFIDKLFFLNSLNHHQMSTSCVNFNTFLTSFLSHFLLLFSAVPHPPGVRKYVIWCLICGGILCLIGVMFLAVYFLLRSYTSTVGYFETVPPFVPSTLVSKKIFCTIFIYSCWIQLGKENYS